MVGRRGWVMVASSQRFNPTYPCPICAGHNKHRRGRGERCYGFLSDDGEWAHCTREELAGGIAVIDGSIGRQGKLFTTDIRSLDAR